MSIAYRGQYPYLDDWQFWRVCLITQIREFEVDLLRNDEKHAIKELVDCVTVAIDALRLKGYDPWRELYARLIENSSKYVEQRGKEFYENKLKTEEALIVSLGGSLTSSEYCSMKEHYPANLIRVRCGKGCGLCGT